MGLSPPFHGAMDRFRPSRPLVFGLVGGVAAGKSAVAAAFAAHGIAILDADVVAREVVAEPAVAAALRRAFGPAIFTPDDVLDRAALAAVVFRDREARAVLESITHPAIRARLLDSLRAHLREGTSVVLDVPLLLEGGLVAHCDLVVFVDASDETRRARARTRGWADGELERREAAQTSLAEKSARADATIRNDGGLADTQRQVTEFLSRCVVTPPAPGRPPDGP